MCSDAALRQAMQLNPAGGASVRVGLDTRFEYLVILLDHAEEVVPAADDGRALAHFLCDELHLGRARVQATLRTMQLGDADRPIVVNRIEAYDEREPAGALPSRIEPSVERGRRVS